MRRFLRGIIYSANPLSKMVYSLIYFKWLRRYKKKTGFVFSNNIKEVLDSNHIFEYHKEEKVHFSSPLKIVGAESPNLMKFYENRTFTLPKGEAYIFEEAYLLGPEAVGLTSAGDIISDTALDEPVVLHKCSPNLLMNLNSIPVEATKEWCVSLVHIFSSNTYTNYFHWLMDSLILLEGVEFLEKKFNRRIKLIVNKNRSSFQDEYLKLLGYTSTDLIEWDFQKIKVSNLVVVKSRRVGVNRNEVMSRQGLLWLKNKLIPYASKTVFGDKVYITRKNNEIRKVVNEPEIEHFLKEKGFVTVDLDNLTVADQIKLFKDVKVIVSPHGAGLANMIYSTDLKIIELIGNIDNPKDYYWYAAYYSMANVLNFKYSFLACEALPINEKRKVYKQIYNLNVSLSGLKETLELL